MLFDRELNAFGNRKLDRVRIAERQHHILAFHFGAVSDADDVEILLEAGGDAGDGVRHQRARQAVQRAVLVESRLAVRVPSFCSKLMPRGHAHVHLALGALHFDFVGLDVESSRPRAAE